MTKFDQFQGLSNTHNIAIGVGMPTLAENEINISMIIFQANQTRTSYSKQILHSDELPYFVCGNHQTYLTISNKKVALGICYESLQREHFLNAIDNNAEIYIASVAKSQSGMDKAHFYFQKIAKEYRTPVLISNCVGPTDNFIGNGRSAVWNSNGSLIEQFGARSEALLVYDTILDSSKIHTFMEEEHEFNEHGK